MFSDIAKALASIAGPVDEPIKWPGLRLPGAPMTVEEAFRRDWKQIGADMYQAIEKVRTDVKESASA